MTTLLIRGLVAGIMLALLAAPTATAVPPAAETHTSHASAVEAAKKAKKKAKKAKRAKTTSSFGMTKAGGKAALGTVSSKNAKCIKNRKVKLFQIRPGKSRKLVGVDRKTGKPAGDGDGFWIIRTNLKLGRTYQAVVTKRVVGKVTCRAYKSSKLPYLG